MRGIFFAAILVGLLTHPAQAQKEASTAHLGTKIANLTFNDEKGQT